MKGRVSAFAARKAAQPAHEDRSAREITPVESVSVPDQEIPSKRPKRRRKTKSVKELPINHRRNERASSAQNLGDGHVLATPEVQETIPGSNSGKEATNYGNDEVLARESDSDSDDESSDLSKRRISQDINLVRQFSTFIPTESNVLEDTGSKWTVCLKRTDSLALLGQYDLWVRKGAVGVYGAVLHASSVLHRVYAPSVHAISVIKPIRNPYGPEHQPVEVSIISCRSRIRIMKHIAPKFGRLWNGRHVARSNRYPPLDDSGRTFIHLRNSSDDIHQRPLNILEPSQDWSSTIQRIVSGEARANPAVVLVCGPKGSGKSTFCRFIANALCTIPSLQSHSSSPDITEVGAIFLDLDPGQPEYSPPGEISLLQIRSCTFGAPFTHPIIPPTNGSRLIRAHHVGYLSPRHDPQHYLDCALDLVHMYTRQLKTRKTFPLIFNCSGWIQGGGLDLLVALIGQIPLTDVIYTSTSGPEEVVDTLGQACSARHLSLQQLSSQPSPSPAKSASELRMMQTLSYFHLSDPEDGNLRWDPSPLTERAPLVVHYAGPNQAIFAVMILGDAINVESFDCVLEGCVVGIVVLEDDSAIPVEVVEASQDPLASSHSDGESSSSPNDLMDEDHPSVENESQGLSMKEIVDVDHLPTNVDPSGHRAVGDQQVTATPDHLVHRAIRRTSTGIPYLPPVNHTTIPLSPKSSHSLGQALIRSIDSKTKALHLLTPVPSSTLQSLHAQKRKIVLVRGKLDTPTWAYKEDLEREKSRGKMRERELGGKVEYGAGDVRMWARKQPWASVVEGGRKGSARARRVRRDLRYRGQAGGEMAM